MLTFSALTLPLRSRLALVGLLLVPFCTPASASAGATVAAPVADALTARLAACISCHAREEKRDAYFPRIAGKPATYLYNQLINFREGRRNYPLMTYMVAHQSDAYLAEMADYFSRLSPSYPPAPASNNSIDQAMLTRGQTLVERGDASRKIPACAACHGASLNGGHPAIPGLLGLPGDYINAQFGAWRNQVRHAAAPDCMAEIANRLSSADVAAVSQWLSRQTPSLSTHPAARPTLPLPLDCGSARQP
ncbi:MAG: c-type cytochrome [Burkholderiaceae bacterium]|nr:c-type cytochrome [Burkholderiaceae bacterium]